MNEAQRDNKLTNGTKEQLKSEIHHLEHLLRFNDTFTAQDCRGCFDPTLLQRLHHIGAIQKVKQERIYVPENGNRRTRLRTTWEWNPKAKRFVKNALNEMDTLPCGHRAHVYNPRDTDGYSCKHWEENGESPQFSRDTVEKVL